MIPTIKDIAYIGVGSNLNDPVCQIIRAIETIAVLPHVILLDQGGVYETRPLGEAAQPNYINTVVKVETALTPRALLKALHKIEHDFGRRREGPRWTARILDLDLLLYGDLCLQKEDLTLPHPRMVDRDFVLQPLYDVAKNLRLPEGDTVQALLGQVTTKTIIGQVCEQEYSV